MNSITVSDRIDERCVNVKKRRTTLDTFATHKKDGLTVLFQNPTWYVDEGQIHTAAPFSVIDDKTTLLLFQKKFCM